MFPFNNNLTTSPQQITGSPRPKVANMSTDLLISAICPVYNESSHINSLLNFFLQALPVQKELIVIDGNSTDDTCEIVRKFQVDHPQLHIQLLHNPDTFVPFALNKAITAAKGNILVRLDAHTDYSPDYFQQILQTFEISGADIVGGPMRIAEGNSVQNAIGYVTSTTFGVGNSSFHFEAFEGFTETVYLGAWRREIFEKTGLFDTAFKRNQDDEFHYRAKSLGFRVYQHPSIKLFYHPRKTLSLLFSQYYQYGLYKPLVLKKIRSAINLRHIIPSVFVLYVLMLPLLVGLGMLLALLPLALYIITALFFAITSGRRLAELGLIPLVYFVIHLAYGSGFISGLLKNPASTNTSTSKKLIYR